MADWHQPGVLDQLGGLRLAGRKSETQTGRLEPIRQRLHQLERAGPDWSELEAVEHRMAVHVKEQAKGYVTRRALEALEARCISAETTARALQESEAGLRKRVVAQKKEISELHACLLRVNERQDELAAAVKEIEEAVERLCDTLG